MRHKEDDAEDSHFDELCEKCVDLMQGDVAYNRCSRVICRSLDVLDSAGNSDEDAVPDASLPGHFAVHIFLGDSKEAQDDTSKCIRQ